MALPMVEANTDTPRGIVSSDAPFSLHRFVPAPSLRSVVAHYWIVRWDLRGRPPLQQHVIPHPVVHLVAEADHAQAIGVVEDRFTRTLQGHGRVLGIALRPAGFSALYSEPVSTLTGRTMPLTEVFGEAATGFHAAVVATDEDAELVRLADRLLSRHQPTLHPDARRARDLVEHAATDPTLNTVQQLAAHAGIGVRALQRLLRRFVGVGPKWVILRYRLHEALARLDQGTPVDWAALALDLGYFDQAHFIKHFKAFVGLTPTEYARQARGST